MTNHEKLTQIDNLAELLYNNCIHDNDWCTGCEDPFKVEKESCIKCVKKWLENEEAYENERNS